jgi:hypothetical protein
MADVKSCFSFSSQLFIWFGLDCIEIRLCELTRCTHPYLVFVCFFSLNSPLGLRAPYQSQTIIKRSFLFFPFIFSSENKSKEIKEEKKTRIQLCRNLHGNATVMIIRGKEGWLDSSFACFSFSSPVVRSCCFMCVEERAHSCNTVHCIVNYNQLPPFVRVPLFS